MAEIEADVIIVGSGISGRALAEKSGAELYPQTTATKVDVDPDRRIASIHFKRWDGEGKASGRVFVLAAHGIEIPWLLLNSRSEATPQGVANSSDQVGRNDHPAQLRWALAPEHMAVSRAVIDLWHRERP